jgi:hypothetical protein
MAMAEKKDPYAVKLYELAAGVMEDFHNADPEAPMGELAAVTLDKVRAIADMAKERLDAALQYNDLAFLWNEVHLAGDVMRTIDPGEVFGGMTCTEAQWLADIFAAAGDQKTHDFIIDSHAWSDDDEEDEHHNLYLRHKEE